MFVHYIVLLYYVICFDMFALLALYIIVRHVSKHKHKYKQKYKQ